MKTLIIPDIHDKFTIAEAVINLEQPDSTVFLGDYFDSYFDILEEALYRTDQTASWLENSLKQKNRIHLIGNHDMNYITDKPELQRGGYAKFRHDVIKRHNIDWKKLKLYYWLDEKWLCTHAGFSLWCDYNEEFEPIPELNQIFGHTPLRS